MLGKIYHYTMFALGRVIVTLQSLLAWMKTRKKPTIVHHEAAYDGRPIMLLALYEKGVLRPDVVRLLKHAHDAGLYVVGVNTLKLRDPAAQGELLDCYIERPNYGRDFGSYQTAFMHVYERGWDRTCSRLLMVNGSVYYSSDRLPAFLAELIAPSTEVLGATENYEIERHLGSFCVAMNGSVLRSPLLRKFWNDYQLSDVRPRVIHRGEMRLSKALKRIVSSPLEFGVLYSSTRFARQLRDDDDLLEFAIRNGRSGENNHWRRVTPKKLMERVTQRFLIAGTAAQNAEMILPKGAAPDMSGGRTLLADSAFVATYEDVLSYLRERVSDPQQVDNKAVRAISEAFAIEAFMEGSQIHQNAPLMLAMGLPIIKLDGLYRGVFNLADVRNLTDQLPEQEAEELRALLMDRPFGGDTLRGWKRAAFRHGYQ